MDEALSSAEIGIVCILVLEEAFLDQQRIDALVPVVDHLLHVVLRAHPSCFLSQTLLACKLLLWGISVAEVFLLIG